MRTTIYMHPELQGDIYVKSPNYLFDKSFYNEYVDKKHSFEEFRNKCEDLWNPPTSRVEGEQISISYLKEDIRNQIIEATCKCYTDAIENEQYLDNIFNDEVLYGDEKELFILVDNLGVGNDYVWGFLKDLVLPIELKTELVKNFYAETPKEIVLGNEVFEAVPEDLEMGIYNPKTGLGHKIDMSESRPNIEGDYTLRINITVCNEHGEIKQPEIIEQHNIKERLLMRTLDKMIKDDIHNGSGKYVKVQTIEPKKMILADKIKEAKAKKTSQNRDSKSKTIDDLSI